MICCIFFHNQIIIGHILFSYWPFIYTKSPSFTQGFKSTIIILKLPHRQNFSETNKKANKNWPTLTYKPKFVNNYGE